MLRLIIGLLAALLWATYYAEHPYDHFGDDSDD